MGLIRLTKPTESLVTLAEVKARLRIDIGDDDDGIARLIDTATRLAEVRTQRAFLTQQWAYTAKGFPNRRAAWQLLEQQGYHDEWPMLNGQLGCHRNDDSIALPLPPLQSVESISYIDVKGVPQSLSPDDYIVDTTGLVGIITPAYGKTWPNTQRRAQAVRIEFTCGYGTAAEVEPEIILAVLQLVGHFDVNRDGTNDKDFESAVDTLLAPYAVGSF